MLLYLIRLHYYLVNLGHFQRGEIMIFQVKRHSLKFALAFLLFGLCVTTLGIFPALAAYTVTTTIPTGNNPFGVGINRVTNTIYVANSSNDTVNVIDGGTNTVSATILVGNNPTGVGINEATNTIYVAHSNTIGNTVSVINGATNTVTTTIAVGSNSQPVVVNVTTNTIYVANYNDNTVNVIDGATNTVTATIPVGANPSDLAVNETTNTIYVANYTTSTVSVIDGATNTVTSTIPVGTFPIGVAVNALTNTVYVTSQSDNSISVIDATTNTVTGTIPVGVGPYMVRLDPTLNLMYVTFYSLNNVQVIDSTTNTVIATVPVGFGPYNVEVNTSTHTAYVANLGNNVGSSDSVSVIQNILSAALSVTKTDAPDPIVAGSNLTYTLNVTNAGPDPAINASLSDPLPVGTTFVSVNAPVGWTCTTPAVGSGGTVSCNISSLAVGGPATFTLVIAVPANYAGTNPISNTATITADDNSNTNNTATTTTNIVVVPTPQVGNPQIMDPAIVKRVDLQFALPGETVTFTIVVSNPTAGTLDNVIVNDPIPVPLTLVNATTSQGTVTINGNTVSFTIGTLAPGQAVVMTVAALVPETVQPGLDVTNTALLNGKFPAIATVHIVNAKLPSTGEHP
jgi:uncharacterized repeat protein (TIGR01451 family)